MVKNNAVEDYRHDATRKNNPPAGLAAIYEKPEREVRKYAYDPHLDPQLVWAGKAGLKCYEIDPDQTSFEVDVVSLHIHERVSTKAIIDAVKRNGKTVQLKLFEEPELPMDKQIEFYKHEMGWVNRLILGDSLLVMNSLLVKEGMAGKIQMIYIDPPYGIKYSSNFQPRIDKRDVKDKDEDLTREPEQIKAYRDTWQLGIHSYLSYLRDRLLLCRELLAETGSIFVQINDENLHLVRCLMDEVFGRENFVAIISFRKRGGITGKLIPITGDYLVWYAKNKERMKYHQLFLSKRDVRTIEDYTLIEFPDGSIRKMTNEEKSGKSEILSDAKILRIDKLDVSGNPIFPFEFQGKTYKQPWKTNLDGLNRLVEAERVTTSSGGLLVYKRYLDDYPVIPLNNNWDDTQGARDKMYAVQTDTTVVERCILMTTDPGDLVFDPTCGSGTTAYCAEKWGRRWITCDTSRVAIAIARQRLMTAVFDYYELADPEKGVSGGFIYETVPHITLQSIANNPKIDEIAEKYNPKIKETLNELNRVLGKDMKEWEVPRECPDNWDDKARVLHQRFWQLKRQKREEIDKAIRENAPQEILYDRPKINKKKVRVCGPFTVEAIPIPAVEDPSQSPIPQFEDEEFIDESATNYINFMIEQLRQVGYVQFPGNRKMELNNVRTVNIGMIHAEAETEENGAVKRVAISFGPQYGPITVKQITETIPTARLNGYDILIFAGFAIDPEAQATIQKAELGMTILFANVSPDVMLKDLLKTTKSTPLFTVFGEPDILIVTKENAKDWQNEYEIPQLKDGEYCVILRGIDVYDPNTGTVEHVSGKDVAAWFLDTDYNGMSFHICQAFFPPTDAWKKLKKALKAHIDPEIFDRMRGVVSLPFKPGEHGKIAVKVIDFRGNEVIKIVKLGDPSG